MSVRVSECVSERGSELKREGGEGARERQDENLPRGEVVILDNFEIVFKLDLYVFLLCISSLLMLSFLASCLYTYV